MFNTELLHNPGGSGVFYSHQILHSVRFDEDSGDSIYRTPSSTGNRKTFTVSFWLKRTVIAHSGNHMVIFGADNGSSNYWQIRITNADVFNIAGNGGFEYTLNRRLLDTATWSNYIVAVDMTQSSSSDRCKIYIDGTQDTDTSYNNVPSQNHDTAMNQSGVTQELGILGYASNTSDFAGYIAEFVIIDGLALGPDSFGETKNGVWVPKDPSGLTFGTNGLYLKFGNSGALGTDSSGNSNTCTSGLPAKRQVVDSPTNQVGD